MDVHISLQTAVLVLFLAAIIKTNEGCHDATHARRKRSGVTSVEDFFPPCLKLKLSESSSYDGLVKFVVEFTNWFSQSEAVDCNSTMGLDTVECWSQAVTSLINEDSPLYYATIKCFNEFNIFVKTGIRIMDTEITRLKQYKPRKNDHNCPPRSEVNFAACVNSEMSDDRPISDLESVLKVIGDHLKCSNCHCTKVLDKNKNFENFMKDHDLRCDVCWSSRVAALATDDSDLTEPLRACAASIDDVSTLSAVGPDLIVT